MKKLVVRFKSVAYEIEQFAIEIANEKFSTFISCIAIDYEKIEIWQSHFNRYYLYRYLQ